MTTTELAQTARMATGGGMGAGRAIEVLATQAAPDPKVLEAARRLKIEGYLQPDHLTSNQAYRELAQAVKSIPGSQARAAELTGLETVGKQASRPPRPPLVVDSTLARWRWPEQWAALARP